MDALLCYGLWNQTLLWREMFDLKGGGVSTQKSSEYLFVFVCFDFMPLLCLSLFLPLLLCVCVCV